VRRELQKELWSAPNIVTLVRIGAIPVFLVFTYYESRVNSFLAALVYTFTAATDFLDGWLARRMNLVTVIGKFLDPLADKLIAMAALVMLVHLGRVAAWVVILVMAREFAVTGLRTIAMSEGVVIGAGQEGKWKTAVQLVGIVFLLLHYPYPIALFLFVHANVDFNRVGTVLLYVSLFFSLWSAWIYFAGFMHQVYLRPAAPDPTPPPERPAAGPSAPHGAGQIATAGHEGGGAARS